MNGLTLPPMHRAVLTLLVAVMSTTLAACSGGDDPPNCSLKNPAQLATSTWPKFRANPRNTGVAGERPDQSVLDIAIAAAPAVHRVFPCATGPLCACSGEDCDATPKGSFSASPVINQAGDRIYIGSSDGTLYALRADTLLRDENFNLTAAAAITSTAVAAVRNEQDAVFTGSADGYLYAVDAGGALQEDYWPYLFGGFVAASPAILDDGTILTGALSGLFIAVCPNGIPRFGVGITGTQSAPAVDPNGISYFGTDDRDVRAVRFDGQVQWAFSTSQPVFAAPVVDVQGGTIAIFVADRGGRIYKLNTSGRTVGGFTNFQPVGPITSSPALANGRLYFGSDDGNLYAVSATDGSLVWSLPTGGAIVSSPAVAVGGNQVVVVVGSTDGKLYFVDDADPGNPWVVPLTPGLAAGEPVEPIQSSPAIAADGTVYIGTNAGRVYAVK